MKVIANFLRRRKICKFINPLIQMEADNEPLCAFHRLDVYVDGDNVVIKNNWISKNPRYRGCSTHIICTWDSVIQSINEIKNGSKIESGRDFFLRTQKISRISEMRYIRMKKLGIAHKFQSKYYDPSPS